MAEKKFLLGNVKGAKGDTGAKGATGDKGAKGDTGAKGADGAKGDKGDKGNGIKSIDIGAENAQKQRTITITLDDGTKKTYTVQNGVNGTNGTNGKDGAKGERGEKGEQGVGIADITQTQTGDTDGAANVVVFSLTDGRKSAFTVRNGSTAGADAMKSAVIANASAGLYQGTTIADYLQTLNKDIGYETQERQDAIAKEKQEREVKKENKERHRPSNNDRI